MLAGYSHDLFAKGSQLIASNFRVFDRFGLLSNTLKSKFSTDGYSVSNTDVKIYLYSLKDYEELISFYQNLPISSNQIFVFCFQNGSNVTFKLRLSDNLREKSRFLTIAEMRAYTKNIAISSLQDVTLSPKYLMSLFGEGYLTLINEAFLANPKAKCPIYKELGSGKAAEILKSKDKLNITIGIFFDGTKNNRYCTELVNHGLIEIFENNEEVKRVKDEKDKFEKAIDIFIEQNPKVNGQVIKDLLDRDGCSYLDPYTNVVLLHDLYNTNPFSKENSQNDVIIKQYVQGVGTQVDLDEEGKPTKFYRDEVYDSGTGMGDNGIESKLQSSCLLIANQLLKIVKASGQDIGSLTFDLFGFSRGAATARLFSNDVLKEKEEKETETGSKIMPKGGELGYRLEELNVKFPEIITLRFLGIFDTVLEDFLGKINEKSISLENFRGKCLHIIALDEYRKNFPLTPAPSDLTKEGEIYNVYLFGSHGDIGGGYNSRFYDPALKSEQAFNKSELNDFVEIEKKYKERFGIEIGSNNIPKFKHDNFETVDVLMVPGFNPPKYLFKLINKRIISNKISLVSLYAMLEYCQKEKLPFIFEFDEKGNIVSKKSISKYYELSDNEDFRKYLNEVRRFVSDKRSGKIQLDKKTFYNLYREFIHISANYDNPYIGSYFVDRPTDNKKRVGMEDKYCE